MLSSRFTAKQTEFNMQRATKMVALGHLLHNSMLKLNYPIQIRRFKQFSSSFDKGSLFLGLFLWLTSLIFCF